MGPRGVRIVALGLGFAAAACSSRQASAPKKPQQPVSKVYDVRGEATKMGPDGVEEHVHVWEQAGIHPYQVMRDGVPNTELCVISRCVKCGAQMHECERKAGRRRQEPAR